MENRIVLMAVKLDIEDLQKNLYAYEKEQFPFACSMAINKTLSHVQQSIKSKMPQIFDRPTPFTINSLYARMSSKKSLQGEIGYKEWASKGTPAGKYLYQFVYGGERRQKASERLLQSKGLIPSGSRLIMADAAPKNQYGNIPASKYVQILSAIGAHSEQGFTANSKAKAKRNKYFIGSPRGGDRAFGIYERTKGSLKPLFFIAKRTDYKVRFPIQTMVETEFYSKFQTNFDHAMGLALFTRKE